MRHAGHRGGSEVRLQREDAPLSIAGSDIDPEALTLCGRHIRQAGLEGRVRVHRQDLKTLTLEGPAGVFLLNPPYGERMLEQRSAQRLYSAFGRHLKYADGWKKYIISSEPEFEHYYGKQAVKKRKLYNGRLQCNVYMYY